MNASLMLERRHEEDNSDSYPKKENGMSPKRRKMMKAIAMENNSFGESVYTRSRAASDPVVPIYGIELKESNTNNEDVNRLCKKRKIVSESEEVNSLATNGYYARLLQNRMSTGTISSSTLENSVKQEIREGRAMRTLTEKVYLMLNNERLAPIVRPVCPRRTKRISFINSSLTLQSTISSRISEDNDTNTLSPVNFEEEFLDLDNHGSKMNLFSTASLEKAAEDLLS